MKIEQVHKILTVIPSNTNTNTLFHALSLALAGNTDTSMLKIIVLFRGNDYYNYFKEIIENLLILM